MATFAGEGFPRGAYAVGLDIDILETNWASCKGSTEVYTHCYRAGSSAAAVSSACWLGIEDGHC